MFSFAPEPILWTRVSKRRCYWSRCTFCSQNAKFDTPQAPARSEILASLDRVTAYSDAGYKQFMFSDEAISPSSLNLIADEIAKRGLQIKWACRSKMERAHTPDMFRRLGESGCFEILFGLETISPRILILMDKLTEGLDEERVPGMCVLDVGANEGLFTLFFRKRVGPGGRVIALEPSERELTHLKRNLRINRFLDVEVVPLAVGDHVGRARLSLAEAGHAGHNALGTPAAPWVSVVDQVEVEVSTLDTLSDARNWPRIDLIKMDIEGSELRALRGADRLLARDRPMLLLEAEQESLSLRGASFSQLLSWLAARKYRAMDFSSTDGRPTPLDTREPSSINLVFMPEEKRAPWPASSE